MSRADQPGEHHADRSHRGSGEFRQVLPTRPGVQQQGGVQVSTGNVLEGRVPVCGTLALWLPLVVEYEPSRLIFCYCSIGAAMRMYLNPVRTQVASHPGRHHSPPALQQAGVRRGHLLWQRRRREARVASLRPRRRVGGGGLLSLPVPEGRHAGSLHHQPGSGGRAPLQIWRVRLPSGGLPS